MRNLIVIFYVVVTIYCMSFQLIVGLENGIFGDRVSDFIDDSIGGSGDADIPFLLPETLEEVKKLDALETLRESQIGMNDGGILEAITNANFILKDGVDAGEDGGEILEAVTNANLILKEIMDTGEDGGGILEAVTNANLILKEVVGAGEDGGGILEAVTNANLILKEIVDTGEDGGGILETVTNANLILKKIVDTDENDGGIIEAVTNANLILKEIVDTGEDGGGILEAVTNANLILSDIADTGKDELKIGGAAMDFFEEIKEIPKEVHDSFKDSAKNVWNKAKKVSGHLLKVPNQVSDMWKKSSLTTEETSNGQRKSSGGLFGFRRVG